MTVTEPTPAAVLPRLNVDVAAIFELGKPRLALAATAMSLCGLVLAAPETPSLTAFLLLAAGMLLTSFGSGGMNMVLERNADARMPRTSKRPLPSGRVSVAHATTYSLTCVALGLGTVTLLGPGACFAAASMFVLYVLVYTPLKRRTAWNTVVGAVPGAIPPIVGTLGAVGTIEHWGISLFAITFFWQIPHFLPLARIYADDYARGGMRMLPAEEDGPKRTRTWLALWTLATVGASALPLVFGSVDAWATLPLVGLGTWFGIRVLAARGSSDRPSMLRLFRASLVYLALLLAVFLALRT